MGLNASRVWLDRELTACGSSRLENSLLPDVSDGSHMNAPISVGLLCDGVGRSLSVGQAVSGQSAICPS